MTNVRNNATLIGRLARDPIVGTSAAGNKYARFTVMVDRIGKDKGADGISCVAFGKTAETIEQYVKKGTQVAVAGSIQTGSYEKDGQKVYTTDIAVDGFQILTPKKSEPAPAPEVPEEDFMDIGDEEELPFV